MVNVLPSSGTVTVSAVVALLAAVAVVLERIHG
jgi:hypothetical protein